MLALLLALSPGAVAFQASAPSAPAPAAAQSPSVAQPATDSSFAAQNGTVQSGADENETNETTRMTTLGSEPARAAFDSPSLALGSALAMDHDGVRTRLGVGALDQQLEAAGSAEKKKQILNRYRYRIENRIISLEARERQATRAFSNGSLSKSEYLRTLGRIDAAVDETRALIESMQTHQSVRNMETEADTLTGQLVTLDGPVRDRIRQVARGQAPATQVYVETGENGVVLSTIVNGEYVREIIRTDKRDSSKSDEMTMHDVREVIVNRYSWAYNDIERSRGSSGIDGEYGSTNVYQMWFDHSQGRLEVYYDGGTESVFKEVQHKRLIGEDSLPPGPAVTDASENLTLAVNRTYAGGPLRVKLTNATGAPVEGEITIDGEPVGRTSENGVLWTLGPAEQFRVGATYDGRSVNATAMPVNATTTPSSATT